MGAGDRHAEKRFSVAQSGKGDWPFEGSYEPIIGHETCPVCGAEVPVTGNGATIHMDKRDEASRPKRRVCFGKVQ